MRWLDGITDSMDRNLSKLWELGDGQRGLACCSSWGHKEWDTTERLNRTEYITQVHIWDPLCSKSQVLRDIKTGVKEFVAAKTERK